MPSGDHCAVWGCDNDQRYPDKQKILPYVGILRFYSSRNNNDVWSCARAINRDQFKVSMSNNNFVRGYRTFECPILTLCIKEYDCVSIKTFKTCSRDQIYTELIHEDVAFVLVEVIVELDKFAWIQLL